MAIKLSANYSKKLGLPNYSSHSFSASVEVELTDLTQVEAEIRKLYSLLQSSVDQNIQDPGFVPQSNGNSNGHQRQHQNGNEANGHAKPKQNWETWRCTQGQKGMIQRLVNENNLDKQEVENLALQLFSLGVKALNKLQASQLIEELLTRVGKEGGRARWTQNQPQRA